MLRIYVCHCVSNSLPQLLLVESSYRLELRFLIAGAVFLMHLSTNTSTINFQSDRNGEVDNVDFAVESR